jgi:protein-S-isoprenylcysteine O-methyltransferase Ste14
MALLVLIVVSPLLALALLWWYGLRVWRRREERRLLAET